MRSYVAEMDNIIKEVMDTDVQRLIRVLRQKIGSKMYMQDIEAMLERLGDLSGRESDALRFLARDIDEL